MEEKNYFKELNGINVSERVEKKNGLTYLSWAWAWGEIKKFDPLANYIIYERTTEYGPCNYFTDGRYCWVKTGVTVQGIEHIEELPVMDYRNQSIPLEKVTSFDVNKAIQRSLTKAIGRHGLGLYIYAGEDLPEDYVLDGGTENPKAVDVTIVKNFEPAVTSAKDACIPTTIVYTLEQLKGFIGSTVREIGTKTGSLNMYKDAVKQITGSEDFKVNSATQEQYQTVLDIYTKLQEIKL